MPNPKSAKNTTPKAEVLQKKGNIARVDNGRTYDAVRLRAYYNFLERQKRNVPGNEMSDWLEAEKTVQPNRSTG